MSTFGTDLMNQITNGDLREATPEIIKKVRAEVSTALMELLEVGARVRPLMVDSKQVGWVRGVHVSERKLIGTWYKHPHDRMKKILALGTTLTEEEITYLDGLELKAITAAITAAANADLSLYPYLGAFVSTTASETLWHAHGQTLTGYLSRDLDVLDAKPMKLLRPPDHARLWAVLCQHRERAKIRLDETYNAAMVTRALIGKGANKLYHDLTKASKTLTADTDDTWRLVVRTQDENVKMDDGWGHAHHDGSAEGVMREFESMLSEDKHEQFMNKFYDQQVQTQKEQEAAAEERYRKAIAGDIGYDETINIVTERELIDRDLARLEANAEWDARIKDELTAEDRAEERKARRGEDSDPFQIIG